MEEFDYWIECVSSSFEEHGISATKAQIDAVARDFKVAHESIELAFYSPHHNPAPDPLLKEIKSLRKDLQQEREKRICTNCCGRGCITIPLWLFGPTATSQCSTCRGTGKL